MVLGPKYSDERYVNRFALEGLLWVKLEELSVSKCGGFTPQSGLS